MDARAEARRKAIAIATDLEIEKIQSIHAAEGKEKRSSKRDSNSVNTDSVNEAPPNDSFEADLGEITGHCCFVAVYAFIASMSKAVSFEVSDVTY